MVCAGAWLCWRYLHTHTHAHTVVNWIILYESDSKISFDHLSELIFKVWTASILTVYRHLNVPDVLYIKSSLLRSTFDALFECLTQTKYVILLCKVYLNVMHQIFPNVNSCFNQCRNLLTLNPTSRFSFYSLFSILTVCLRSKPDDVCGEEVK
jgi:hypothetical protein